MYCANCGVKLADSEDRCPLCHTPAYHPDIPRQPGRPLFPAERYPDTAKKTLWLSAFLTLTTVFVAAIVLLCDLQMGNGISWSGYVLGGLATFYVALVLPSWFARPNAVIFVPCTFVTIAAYLFYINLAVGGNWFFSFALPITGIVAAIVTTVITCAGGETIRLTLDTTLPRSHYSRDFTVRGTKGMISEEHKVVYLKGMPDKTGDNEAEMFDKYDHPLYKRFPQLADMPGHVGADWLVCRAFVESVKNGIDTPIDAYDTITWMAIAALSEQSVKQNGAPVDIPDFTGGKWQNRGPVIDSIYCLDEIVE